jgi:hypothetical protein
MRVHARRMIAASLRIDQSVQAQRSECAHVLGITGIRKTATEQETTDLALYPFTPYHAIYDPTDRSRGRSKSLGLIRSEIEAAARPGAAPPSRQRTIVTIARR